MMCITAFVTTLLLLVLGAYETYAANTPIMSILRAGEFSRPGPRDSESIPDIHMNFQGHEEAPETAWVVDYHGDSQPERRPAAHQKSTGMTEVAMELKADGARLVHRGLQSLQSAVAESEAVASRAIQGLELLDAGGQDKQSDVNSLKQGLKSLMDILFDEADAISSSARSQIESAEAEMNLALDQRDAMQLLKGSLLRLVDVLKDMGPPEEMDTWLAGVHKVKQSIESMKIFATTSSSSRDGCMLIKHGLASILDVRAASKVMSAELAAEILTSVTQGLGLLEQRAAGQIRHGVESMLHALSPRRQGTKLLQRGLKSVLETLEESNKLVGQVEIATEMLDMGTENSREGTKLVKRGFKSILDTLEESNKLVGQVEIATKMLDVGMDDSREGTKLVKRGLKSVLETLEESNKLVGQVEIATEMFDMVNQKKGRKLVNHGLKSVLDTLEESNKLVGKIESTTQEFDRGVTNQKEGSKLVKHGLNSVLDALEESNKLMGQVEIANEMFEAMRPMQGIKLVKRGLKSILDTLEVSKKLASEIESATQDFDRHLANQKEGTKLVKSGLKSVLDKLEESNKIVDQAAMATEMLDLGVEDKDEGTKLVKRGLKSIMDSLEDSNKLVGQVDMATSRFA